MKVGSYVSQLDTSYKQVPTLKGGAYKYMRIRELSTRVSHFTIPARAKIV
jgi:hypothetical protein